MMHVIIGVGAAGITAAKTIRSQQPDASITMISTDEHVHSPLHASPYFEP